MIPINYSRDDGSVKALIADSKEIVQLYINHPPTGGFTRQDMVIANSIDEKLKTASSEIELERDEVEYLKKIDEIYPWGIRSAEILEFRKSIQDL
jgi:uncharacterized protein YggU (UPF0235/DUF167 family)